MSYDATSIAPFFVAGSFAPPSPDPSKQMASENAAPTESTRHRHSPGALDFSQIVGGASFGRPVMTDDEMEAIDSGGAECAPQVFVFRDRVEQKRSD